MKLECLDETAGKIRPHHEPAKRVRMGEGICTIDIGGSPRGAEGVANQQAAQSKAETYDSSPFAAGEDIYSTGPLPP